MKYNLDLLSFNKLIRLTGGKTKNRTVEDMLYLSKKNYPWNRAVRAYSNGIPIGMKVVSIEKLTDYSPSRVYRIEAESCNRVSPIGFISEKMPIYSDNNTMGYLPDLSIGDNILIDDRASLLLKKITVLRLRHSSLPNPLYRLTLEPIEEGIYDDLFIPVSRFITKLKREDQNENV